MIGTVQNHQQSGVKQGFGIGFGLVVGAIVALCAGCLLLQAVCLPLGQSARESADKQSAEYRARLKDSKTNAIPLPPSVPPARILTALQNDSFMYVKSEVLESGAIWVTGMHRNGPATDAMIFTVDDRAEFDEAVGLFKSKRGTTVVPCYPAILTWDGSPSPSDLEESEMAINRYLHK